ncbi:MAG: hypothetical protein VX899_26635 [Myxococcota bacterium]|nr:hypothetical protein [Myxococcota bacterium]
MKSSLLSSTLLALACGGPLVTFPADEDSAFKDARVPKPAQAQEIHYAGEAGLDHAIDLQFLMPDRAGLEGWLAEIDCVPTALESGDNAPFSDRTFPEAKDWWVPAAPADAQVCPHLEAPGYVRDVRLDPLPGGVWRVQVSMFTL